MPALLRGRFHAGSRGRNGNYSHRELDDRAARLRRWNEEVDVYAHFDNDREGYAIENASIRLPS